MTQIKLVVVFIVFSLSQTLSAQSILFNSSGGTPDASALMELRSTDKGFLAPRMEADDRLGISSPAQGLLVFQIDGTVGFYFYNGSSWDTLGGATTTVNISNVTNIANSGIAVIRDEKASSVNGGTFTSGDWRTRDLNEYTGDSSFISLSTNEFTLNTGTYVVTASAPAFEVSEHQIRLYNVTDTLAEAVGIVAFSDKFAAANSSLTAVITITASTNTYRVEHRCSSSKTNTGMGIAADWGENVYTQVKIEKL